MINRELIRQKVVQLLYAHYVNENHSSAKLRDELTMSLNKAYDLYLTLLSLLAEMGRLTDRNYDTALARAQRMNTTPPSRRLVDNRFMKQLEANEQLKKYREHQSIDWTDEEELVRSMLRDAMALDYVDDYVKSTEESTYEQERELWRYIYRNIVVGDERIDELLEDKNLYWNDDKEIIDTFVLKTINRFTPETTADMPLLPQYRNESDIEFAHTLMNESIVHEKELLTLIDQHTHGWRMERVAPIDRVILQVALCEMQSFPSIPVSVSINEYVEIAKHYSTPNASKYINATLDNISKQLTLNKEV